MQPAKALLKKSVEIFGKYFWQMLLVSLVPYIFSFVTILIIANLIGDAQNNIFVIMGTAALLTFFNFIGQFALSHAAVQVTEGRFSLLQAYKDTIKKTFSLIWINYVNLSAIFLVLASAVLILGLGRVLGNLIGSNEFLNMFLGVLFLLIAAAIAAFGLMLALRLSLASWFLITNKYKGMQASAESLKATSGNVWVLAKKALYLAFWYIIIFIPIAIVSRGMPTGFGDFLKSVFSVIFVPVAVLYIYQVFLDITSNSIVVANQETYVKWLKRSVLVALPLILMIIALLIIFREQVIEFMVLAQML